MTKRLIVAVVLLLIVGIVGIGLGCAAPATPTPTATSTPTATPGVTPTEVAPGVKATRIRICQVYPISNVTGQYIEHFKALLAERSGGKIKVDHYPAAQLFAQTDQYHAVGTGAVEMIVETNQVLAAISNPAWEVIRATDRYWKDLKSFYDFFEEPAGGGYFRAITEKDGVKFLFYPVEASFLPDMVSNNKHPIKKVEDWKGLKIRTSLGNEWIVAPYGALPIPVPTPETVTALQTGMVDGLAGTPISGIIVSGWDRVTKYATAYLGQGATKPAYYPFANLAWWNRLDDATRTMVATALQDTERWVREVWIRENDALSWKKGQAAYGNNFYDMQKEDPTEFERHRVLRSNATAERMKKVLPPEMFNLLEAKYLR